MRCIVTVSPAPGVLGLPAEAAGRAPTLQFPLRLRATSKAFSGHTNTNYVDLDATTKIKDFACGNRSYNGHRGIDIAVKPFGWRMMDGKEAEIIAAAPGTIIDKADGEFDRQCSASNVPANYVVIRQNDGNFAYYWHMKKGSVTRRSIGSSVDAGEFLGLVGSSGSSTGPHLHFEVRTASSFDGSTLDPYTGLCGARGTLWKHQPEYVDTEVLRVATHRVAPNPDGASWCSNPDPGYGDNFAAGSRVWVAAYIRDQSPQTPVKLTVLRPDGQIFATWTSGPLSQVYPLAYWYGQIVIPSTGAQGRWKVQVQLESRIYEHAFMVGGLPQATILTTAITPRSAIASPTSPANFDVVVRNTGSTPAVGCSIAPDAPLAAKWSFRVTAGGIPTGASNEVFDVAPAAAKRIRLSITPKGTYRANGVQIPVRVFCSNGTEAAAGRAKVVTLSF